MSKKRKTYEIQDSARESLKVAEALSPYILSDEFLATPEADFETMTALENMLQRAQGFSLAFARVNVPMERERLATQIRGRLESSGIKIFEIHLPASPYDLLTEITDQLKKQHFFPPKTTRSDQYRSKAPGQQAVFVYGIERSILSSATYHPTLAVLNYKREMVREKIQAPIIFWLPEYALIAIAQGAPDFWAWRSGVFEFITPRQESDKRWFTEQSRGDFLELSTLTKEEKFHRIETLLGLLAEYESLENKEDENIILIRLDLLHRISELYRISGDYDQALMLQNRAYRLATRSYNEWAVARALHHNGMIYQARGEYDRALDQYHHSLGLYQKVGDLSGVSRLYHNMAVIYQARGNYDRALELYDQALTIGEKLGDLRHIGYTRGQMGLVYYERGDFDQALKQYQTTLKISEKVGDQSSISKCYHQMGMVYQARGDDDRALELYGQSLAIAEKLGDLYGVSRSYHQMGMVYQARGDYDRALNLYGQSLAILEKLGDLSGVSSSYHQMGIVHQALGNYDRAVELLSKALALAEKLDDRNGVASSYGQLGLLNFQMQRYLIAAEYFIGAFLVFQQIGSPNVKLAKADLARVQQHIGAEKLRELVDKMSR